MSRCDVPSTRSAARVGGLLAVIALTATTHVARAGDHDEFSYLPPGDMIPGSGEGLADYGVYVPGMRYPIEAAPSYPNSQVWGHGGLYGPGGGQCDVENFSYPWRDNFCEERSWDMPLCPAGTGHQGQDIRAATCERDVHWVVSAADGVVSSVGSYSIYIMGEDGTRYEYLHSSNVQVAEGETVTRGQRLSKVSDVFGGNSTTVHLHFALRQNVDGVGNVYVPPYMSLVEAYQALIGPPPMPLEGALDGVDCAGIRGWTAAMDALDAPIEARLYFDGAPGEGQSIGYPILADRARADLCSAIGSCEHGFETGLPLSLLDATTHAVRAFGSRGLAADETELTGSPKTFSCPLEVPEGVKRSIADATSETSWRFSSFWDVAQVSDGVLATFDEGDPLPSAPRLVATDAAPDELWLIDGDRRRRVPDAAIAAAWEFHPLLAERISADALSSLPQGPVVRSRPFVLRGPGGAAFLIDDAPGSSGPTGAGGSSGDGDEDEDDEGEARGEGGTSVPVTGTGGASGEAAAGCGCEVVGPTRARSRSAMFLALSAVLGWSARRRARKVR